MAICGFDIDHSFAYSRGGKTVESNLVGCHHAANRDVKSNFILQSLSPDEMNTGISSEQLRIVAEGLAASYKKRGQDVSSALWRLTAYLTTPPGVGMRIANFQDHSHGSKDARELFRILYVYFASINVEMPV